MTKAARFSQSLARRFARQPNSHCSETLFGSRPGVNIGRWRRRGNYPYSSRHKRSQGGGKIWISESHRALKPRPEAQDFEYGV